MKKFVSLLLCVFMLFGMMGVTAYADDTYEFFTKRQAINSYLAGDLPAELVIPTQIDGLDIETILDKAFRKSATLEKVVLPEKLMTIAAENFSEMEVLSSITLPETLMVLGKQVIYKCPALTEITLPPRVSYIGELALYGNDALKTIRFTGMAPLYVHDRAMGKNNADLIVYVPDDQIEAYKAVMPEGLNIQPSGQNAIYYDFTASEDEFTFDSATGTITAATCRTPRVDIPATIGGVPVTAIGTEVFKSNLYIYCLNVPFGVTTIGTGAVSSVSNLYYVSLPDTVTEISGSALYGYRGKGFTFPNQLKTIGDKAFYGAVINDAIELPIGLTTIGVSAFETSRFTAITLPVTLTTISDKAFYKCKYYTELTIPASVTSIGSMAFAESDRLETVIVECKAELIPADAFTKCNKLKKIVVPADTDAAVVAALSAATGITVELSDKPYTPVDPSTIVRPEPVPPVVSVPAEGTDAPVAPTEPTTPAAPAGDAEAYLGVWNCTKLDMGGMVMKPSDLGMSVVMTINADGTVSMDMGEGAENATWTLVEGGIEVEGSVLTLNAEGQLVMADEGMAMIFEKGDGTVSADPVTPAAPTTVAGTAEDFIGVWNCTLVEAEGMRLDPAMLGMKLELTLKADGTAVLVDDEGPEEAAWILNADGTAEVDGIILMLTTDGKLLMSEEGATMYFEKGEAVEAPVDMASNPVVGVWNDGAGLTFTVNADGTCVATDSWGDSSMTWEIKDGVPTIITGSWFGAPMVLNEDGTLYVNDGFFVNKTLMPGEYVKPDLSSSPVVGVWNDGNTVTFTVNADGTCVAHDTWGDNNMEWSIKDGVPTITGGSWYGAPMILNEDGTLYVSDGWIVDTTFQPGALAAGEPTTPVTSGAVAGTVEDFVGTWNGTIMDMGGGMTMNMSDLGMNMSVTINADGTAVLNDGESVDTTSWKLTAEGMVEVESMILYLTEDGKLCMTEDGISMYFERGDGTAVTPGIETPAEEAVEVAGELNDFVGLWTGSYMEAEGMKLMLSDMDMTMEITMNADGVITLYDGEATEEGTWTLVDGKADIDGMILTLMSDGTLVGEMDGSKIVFVGYTGVWTNVYMNMGGMSGNTKDLLGMTGTLTLNADGTGYADFPDEINGGWYKAEDGSVYFGEGDDVLPVTLYSGGFLMLGNDMTGYLVYSRDPEAVWTPVVETPAPTEVPAAPSTGLTMEDRMNRKFICSSYTAYGQTMPGSTLGTEWSLFFRENGTADFGMSGMVIPNLPWGSQKVAVGLSEVDAFVINYYGIMFNAVLTDEGFDMDYYGTMTLHFVPAE